MNYLIKKYFQEFESYHEVWVLKNSLFVWLIISLSLFLLGIILWLFVLNVENKEFEKLYMSLILLLEVLVLYLFYAIERQRNEIVKLKFQKIYKNKNLSLFQIKKRWFCDFLAVPREEYLALVEKLEKYYITHSKYSGKKFSREKFFDFIFSTDSKNRILAMFMGLVALFTAMLISTGVNIEYIFDIFDSIEILESFLVVLLVSLSLFGLFYILKYTIFMIVNFFDFIFDNSFNKEHVSRRKREIFIAQLLQLAELPKHKKRIHAVLDVPEKIDSDTV